MHTCLCVCTPYAYSACGVWKREMDARGCELPRGCWKLNVGSPQERQGLLTMEPSVQPYPFLFSIVVG